ncbi:uncharacterized protein LOC109831622 isoform X2 [Asparagus officinalis]|uniref:uncharacterized protein LOC109831622 isoform X2 n=1 Tax=Asparagus officinalis TaxID=4686 RepID=UPI00098E3F1A|nr:uncharacterized protein LOC109831622 isoform X2 [Asparagus officinalis]
MMFDWDDPDQVNETIWGELNQNEDHTVPNPKDSEEHPAFTSKECNKKEGNDDAGSIPQSAGQSSGARDEFPGCVENSSCLASEDHSSSRLEMDPWPDLPSLSSELNTGYNNGNNDGSLEQGLINKMTVQLDGEPEPFGSARDDKGNGSFLDCDWANINDFDDLDRMFRNESIFGHDMVTNMDELLSSSSDMIGSSMKSIPTPDITLSSNQPSDRGCSSFQLAEHSGDKRKVDDKILWKQESQAFLKPHKATNLQKWMIGKRNC